MTIGRKIGVAFALTLLASAAVYVTVYRNTAALIEDARWVVHTHSVLENVESALRAVNRTESSVLGYLISGDDALLSSYQTARAGTDDAVAALDRLTVDNPSQQRRLPELRAVVHAWFEAMDALIRQHRLHGTQAALDQVATSPHHATLRALRSSVFAFKGEEERLLALRAASSQTTASLSLGMIAWGGCATLLTSFAIGALLARAVTRPIRELLRGASEIGSGNLGYRTTTGTQDELGVLARSFNAMADNLSRTMVSADTEKHARLRVEELLQAIAETASNLVSATSEILAGTTQQAAGAQEQAAAVAETVSTIDEVVRTSEQAAARAQVVAEISTRSVDHSRTGHQVVRESIDVMAGVREKVDRSAEGTLALAEQAQAIGTIIESVTEIADLTNLLALNASLEATRAGEGGKAFRVVAAEVKVLADQSKRATTEVRRILGDIQTATSSLVMVAEECSKGVDVASRVINRAGDSIGALAAVIEQSAQAAEQIAASAGQQASGTAQIRQAMTNINHVTKQNLSSTRQMEQAAKDLNRLGGLLRDRLVSAERTAALPSVALR